MTDAEKEATDFNDSELSLPNFENTSPIGTPSIGTPSLSRLASSNTLTSINGTGHKLRLQIGPDLHSTTTYNINSEIPMKITNEYVDMYVTCRAKNFDGVTPDASPPIQSLPYFDGHARLFSLQFQIKFKQAHFTADDLLFGISFQNPVKPPFGFSAIVKFFKLIDPTIDADIYAEQPYWRSYLITAFNAISCWPSTEGLGEWKSRIEEDTRLLHPGDPALLGPGNSPLSVKLRRKHFAKDMNRKAIKFDPNFVYSFELYNYHLDVVRNTVKIPGLPAVDIRQYVGEQPMNWVLASKQGDIIFAASNSYE